MEPNYPFPDHIAEPITPSLDHIIDPNYLLPLIILLTTITPSLIIFWIPISPSPDHIIDPNYPFP